jgi:ribosomal protein S27AE
MIELTLRSLDDECDFYHSVLSRKPEPPPAPVIHRRHFTTTYQSRLICPRCGRGGHLAQKCKEIPSIEELEAENDEDLAECCAELAASGRFIRDEFGFVEMGAGDFAPIPPPTDQEPFCPNCGRSGHSYVQCPSPPAQDLLEDIGQSFTRQISRPPIFPLRH